jgi:hypothetical protein
LFISMYPPSFRCLILPSSPSLSLSPLHLHLPTNSKRGCAPNSSVRITYGHRNRQIICLYLRKRKSVEEKTMSKLKDKQHRSLAASVPSTAIFPTHVISHCTLHVNNCNDRLSEAFFTCQKSSGGYSLDLELFRFVAPFEFNQIVTQSNNCSLLFTVAF